MEILEKLRGRGRVRQGDDVVLPDVPYQVTIWRQAGSSDPVLDGRLTVSYGSAVQLIGSPIVLALELDDGRLLYFTMTSSTGRITNAEH